MGEIVLKVVEYPKERVLELENLTDIGLEDLKEQAQQLIDEIEQIQYKDEE